MEQIGSNPKRTCFSSYELQKSYSIYKDNSKPKYNKNLKIHLQNHKQNREEW